MSFKDTDSKTKPILCQNCGNHTFKIMFVYIHKNSREIKTCLKCGGTVVCRVSASSYHKGNPKEVSLLLEKQMFEKYDKFVKWNP